MTTVCVLFGGKSSEHEVSLKSAYNVINGLNKEKYNLIYVGIKKTGESFLYEGDIENIKDGSWENGRITPCILSPDPTHHGLLVLENGKYKAIHIDVYFPVLHGKNGEDGTIQGVFELSGISYVGNGVLGSSLCMDKILTKRVLKTENIPVTDGFDIIYGADETEKINEKIKASFGYPVVIKPANAGSSVGISLVHTESELKDALKVALNEDRRILVEKMMDVREVECAVLGSGRNATASCLGEIVKKTEMYDYETKYIDDTSELVIPAELDNASTDKIRDLAVKAYNVLDCKGLARVDFFVDKVTGKIYLNEINTLPGFTDISMYPMLWNNVGTALTELLDKLIELALNN